MKFTPRSEDTRQFIIEQTAGMFNKKGYAGTSMTDITEATGLTKGSIYGNFENKEAVALAVFDYNAARKNRVISAYMERTSTFSEKLLVYAEIYSSKQNTAFAEGGCPLLNTGTEADDTHEPLRKRVSAELINWKKQIEDIITGGIAAREFKDTTHPGQIALAIIALIEGGIFIARTVRNKQFLDETLESVRAMVNAIRINNQ